MDIAAPMSRGYLTWTALPGGSDRESSPERREEVIGSSVTEVYLADRERERESEGGKERKIEIVSE